MWQKVKVLYSAKLEQAAGKELWVVAIPPQMERAEPALYTNLTEDGVPLGVSPAQVERMSEFKEKVEIKDVLAWLKEETQ